MDFEIVWVFAVALGALLLFVTEKVPVDQVAMAVPALLLMGGVLTPEQAVSGLAHRATVTVAAVLVLGLGLHKTGAVAVLGRWVRTAPLGGPRTRLFVMCLLVAAVSPFINNTAVVAVMLPVFLTMAANSGTAPSRVLVPLSYAGILGGTVTLIGTSTNLIVHGMARNRGLDELSMFTITPLGLIYLAVGFVYVFTIGRWLLPRRPVTEDLAEKYDVRAFDTELIVTKDSRGVGRAIDDLDWADAYGVEVHGIHRQGRGRTIRAGSARLRPGDVILVRGGSDQILELAKRARLASLADATEKTPRLGHEEGRLAEVLVAPGSFLAHRTLRQIHLSHRFGVTVLGLQRHGRRLPTRIGDARLEAGDLLLVHGREETLGRLADVPGLVPLGAYPPIRTRMGASVAVAILVAVIGAAGAGLVSILAAAVVGAVAMVFTGCVKLDELYREMDWRVLALLAGLIPLGLAMDESGGARLLADGVADLIGGRGVVVAVLVFYLLASFLTEVMTNAAAAVVLTPVALESAAPLETNPYALVVAVMFGCSASFMTPTGYQTNTMIYGPGGYRYTDFLRVGVPLNLTLAVVAALVIPLLWPSG
ncbi:MAG: SLC13 family permease [Myxococcota bacterium]